VVVEAYRTKIICEATPFDSVTEDINCQSLRVEQFFFFDTDSDIGSVELTITVDVGNGDFDPANLRPSDADLDAISANCLSGNTSNGGTCIDIPESPYIQQGFDNNSFPIGGGQIETNINALYEFTGNFFNDQSFQNGNLNYAERSTFPDGNSELEIRYFFERCINRCDSFEVFVRVSSFDRFVTNYTSKDSGIIVNTVLGAVRNDELVNNMINGAFARCCKTTSLGYAEYLGLMIGYMTLMEGLLTFLTAWLVYFLMSKVACKVRWIRYLCRIVPATIVFMVLFALQVNVASERNRVLNDALNDS